MADDTGFRAATAADERAIATLLHDAWRAAYRGLMPDEVLDARTVEELLRSRARPLEAGHRRWVLDRDGAVVAYASAGPAGDDDAGIDTAEVRSFYVAPDRQRGGLGRLLMRHVLAELAAVGYREARLLCLAGNEAAEGFYRALGWVDAGTPVDREVSGHRLPHRRFLRSTG